MKTLLKSILTALGVLSSTQLALSEQNPMSLDNNPTIEIVTNGLNKVIYYSDYGAIGDGVTDDIEAIAKAHAAANEAGLDVCADKGATYYIGGADITVQIQTNTNWNDAKFIIDDTKVKNVSTYIFNVSSKLPSTQITTVKTLTQNQKKLDISLPNHSFVAVTDNLTKRYKRMGVNQNRGSDQTEAFVVDHSGNVDMNAPIIWNFDSVTSMIAYPIDTETLTISGGYFTTLANQGKSQYPYYGRGIDIRRSNVVIDGIYHAVTGELDHGAPYTGFIRILNCTNVIVQNSKFSGHKAYNTIGSIKTSAPMGSYDITVGRSTNIIFKNCKQINDIHDTSLWGIFASNYSKNITFDNVEFSRFDAHMGVENVTIKNSVLGHQGINIIGSGIFLLENTKVFSTFFINLRNDYGSSFNGEFIIRNCEYTPRNGAQSDAVLINGYNSGQHDFGYTCYMPRKITIDGLVINDLNTPDSYLGAKIFAPFNKANTSDKYVEKYPYIITQEVQIKNLTIKSGKPYIISNNQFMFRNVKITTK